MAKTVRTVDELKAWAHAARRGDIFVYYEGPTPANVYAGETLRAAYGLHAKGDVSLVQRRVAGDPRAVGGPGGRFQYSAQRIRRFA